MTESNMESTDFILSALSKFLQTFCSDKMDFDCFVLVTGHLYVSIDTGKALEYVVNEKMCKTDENTTPIFLSNSFKKHSAMPDNSTDLIPNSLLGEAKNDGDTCSFHGKFELNQHLDSLSTTSCAMLNGPVFPNSIVSSSVESQAAVIKQEQEDWSFSLHDECVPVEKSNSYESINNDVTNNDSRGHDKNKKTYAKASHKRRKRDFSDVESDLVQKITKSGKVKKGTAYKCRVCGKFIIGKKEFELHELRHTGEKAFPCKDCNKRFATQLQLDNHAWTHSKEKKFKCEICDHGVNSKYALQYHMRTKHSTSVETVGENVTNEQTGSLIKQEFSGPPLDDERMDGISVAFSKDSELSSDKTESAITGSMSETKTPAASMIDNSVKKSILTKVTKDGAVRHRTCYTCNVCKRVIEGKNQFEVHMLRHSVDKPFPCHICGKMFASPQFVKTHIRLHSQGKRFKCEVCGHRVNTKAHLKYHMTAKHGIGDPPASLSGTCICDQCGKVYPNPSSLRYHRLTHADDKSFVCAVCNRGFLTKRLLDRHCVSHTGEKKYTCETCGRAFSHKHYLTKHRYTHTGERPYVCGICGQGFSSSGTLTTHKRRHTGERPFECKCGKKFTQKGALGVHRRKCRLAAIYADEQEHAEANLSRFAVYPESGHNAEANLSRLGVYTESGHAEANLSHFL